MLRILFNDGWYVKKENGKHGGYTTEEAVTLPHDGMISTVRRKEAWNGTKKAFFENGVWEYRKEFEVSEQWAGKRIFLEFEGVYMQALIYVNGCYVGKHIYGYTEFAFEISGMLKTGMKNEIKVIARTGDDSRWYSGSGIYRNVNLMIADPVHIKNNGVFISTPAVEKNRAQILIVTEIINENADKIAALRVVHEIRKFDGELITQVSVPITLAAGEEGKTRQRINIDNPVLWDTDNPVLYYCTTKVLTGEQILDESEDRFGIRSIVIDTKSGFLLNGEMINLRGACIHHDNGVIGARTFASAEMRRIRKLKEAGFNAIRMAHHPAGRAILSACDELGMLVMDEAFDMWRKQKSSQDYGLYFEQEWEKDIEAMIRKDYNHPSVVIYSIGNEIPDPENPVDAVTGRKIVEKIHSIDTTRFTTNGVNGILLFMNKAAAVMGCDDTNQDENNQGEGVVQEINETMASMDDMIRVAVNMPFMDEAIEEVCSQVDIAGYNYMADRYEADQKKYPNRIIVGTETYPKDIYRNWQLVKQLPNVIGDFTWTGWDYLGETGIGKVTYDEEVNTFGGFYGEYPYITAHCGDIDITGYRLPASYYREIVFGLRQEPYIAVSRPEMAGKKMNVSIWGWSDVVNSWSFEGHEGTRLMVEVYTSSEEIELFINEKSYGRKKVTDEQEYKVVYEVIYEPGNVTAVSYRNGKESGRYELRSAGKEKRLCLQPEKRSVSLKNQELIFINLSVTDEENRTLYGENPGVELFVEGAGKLIGFGSGAAVTEESYTDTIHTLCDGRAFAVILPTQKGEVTIRTKADGYEAVTEYVTVSD